MSSIHNVSAEDLAKLFHHYHEALANDFHGHASRQADSCWEQAPQNERTLMIAAARLTLLELAATHEGEPANRQYFAKPGEAEARRSVTLVSNLYEFLTNRLVHLYARSCEMTLAASS
jgi:hypothetical protein